MKKMKRTLILIDLAFYLFSAIFFTVANLWDSVSDGLLSFYWTISVWIIVLTNFFSTRRINKYTEMLGPEKGIFANERFMLIYNGCFFVAVIFDTVSFVMLIFGQGLDDPCTT